MKKSLIQRIKIGLIKGWNIPVLPQNVIVFLDTPLVRFLRVLGGISVMIILFKKHILFPQPLEFLILFLGMMQMLQITIISVIKLGFSVRKLWKNKEEFEVRNTPVDRAAGLATRLLYCWKVGCYVGSSVVSLVGTSVLIDTVLDASGQDKIFQPLMSKGIQGVIGGRRANTVFEELRNKVGQFNTARLEEAKEAFSKLETTSQSIEKELVKTVDKGFIGSNFFEFFESYNAIGKLAISLLFFNYVVLSSLTTIVLIYYGDFLIKYLNLELKYPKLAKIIQLRRKFQGYYFLFSVFSIAFVVLIETLFSFYILTL